MQDPFPISFCWPVGRAVYLSYCLEEITQLILHMRTFKSPRGCRTHGIAKEGGHVLRQIGHRIGITENLTNRSATSGHNLKIAWEQS